MPGVCADPVSAGLAANRRSESMRIFQYRLRSLFVLTTIVAIALIPVSLDIRARAREDRAIEYLSRFSDRFSAEHFSERRRVVFPGRVKSIYFWGSESIPEDAIRKLECFADLSSLNVDLSCVTDEHFELAQLPPSLERVRAFRCHSLGDRAVARLVECCPRIRELSLHCTSITDHSLALLAQLSNLEELDLSDTDISEENLAELVSGCGRLRVLNLDDTKVGNGAIKILAEARNLRILDLADAGITEEGIASLSSLNQLTWLTVWGHRVDRDTQTAVRESLPNTRVTVGPVR